MEQPIDYPSSILVFVYGSLKQGFHNHSLLEKSKFLGSAHTLEKYRMIDMGAFPAILLEPTSIIQGELYEVSQETFNNLDMLEGYPDFYNRIRVPVFTTEVTEAWIYYMSKPKYNTQAITSGYWTEPKYNAYDFQEFA